MTFNPELFVTLGGQVKRGVAYQKFGYKTSTDSIATITTTGYFNDSRESISRYDIIEVNDLVNSPNRYVVLLVTARPLNGDVETEIVSGAAPSTTVNRITVDTTLDDTYDVVFCDTDGGAITVTLPAGSDGDNFRIINCGSSGNNVTITPNGSELLLGCDGSQTFYDAEVIDLIYEETEGWR